MRFSATFFSCLLDMHYGKILLLNLLHAVTPNIETITVPVVCKTML